MPYFLTTERIGFGHWGREDLSLAQSLWGVPEVTRYISANGRFSPEQIGARLETECSHLETYGVQYFSLFTRESGALVGCCGLRPYGEQAGVYELGFHLKPEYWGQGYACEAAWAMIGWAFSHLHAKQLRAGHHPENAASRRVLEKLGFRCIGTEFYAPTGLYHPAYILENK